MSSSIPLCPPNQHLPGDRFVTIDSSVDYKFSFNKDIAKDAVYFTGHDPIFGSFLAIIYKSQPNSDCLSSIIIGKHGVNESVDMTLSPASRYYSACLNLPQQMANSLVRKALAIACLRTYANIDMNLKTFLTESSKEALQFDWDETTAGTLAGSMVPAIGKFPQEIGSAVVETGILEPKVIKSVVVDIIYQDMDTTNDSNNELVYLFGNQLEHLFDPLSEYSPEPTEMLYSPPIPFAAQSTIKPTLRKNDNDTIQSVCHELYTLQSHFVTDLIHFLQEYIIPLRVKALSGELPDLTIRKLNMIFPPTIDEVVRVNSILYEALDAALPFGSYEVMKACGISIPYFYKACMRHEAATRNFTHVINENYDLLKIHAPLVGRYTVHRMEAIIHFSLHLTRIKLVLERLVKVVQWLPEELPTIEEFYLSAVGTIDSFGREPTVSPYDNRIFTGTGKLLVEISKDWPQELEYGWINRRVVSIFDVQDITGENDSQHNIIFIFTDAVVVIKPTEPAPMTSDSGIHKPSIADMLMHSMINSMPLTNLPDLVVVGWAPIEDVYFANFSDPKNLTMYITGKGLRINHRQPAPKAKRQVSSLLLVSPTPSPPPTNPSSKSFVHQKLFRLVRPGIDADAVMHFISKAKIMNKTQPFHLFQSLSPANNLTTYATVHEYQGYRLESRKCPIGIFVNMKVTPAILDNYGLVACIGLQIYDDNFILLKVVSKLDYNTKKIIKREQLSRKIANHVSRIYSLLFSSANNDATEMILQNNEELANFLVKYATTEKKQDKNQQQLTAARRRVSKGKMASTPTLLTPVPQSPYASSPVIGVSPATPSVPATPVIVQEPVKAVPQVAKSPESPVQLPAQNESKRLNLRKRVSASSIISRLTQRSHEFLRSSTSSTIDSPRIPDESFPVATAVTTGGSFGTYATTPTTAPSPMFSHAASSTVSLATSQSSVQSTVSSPVSQPRRKSSFNFLRRVSGAKSPKVPQSPISENSNASTQSLPLQTKFSSNLRHSFPITSNNQASQASQTVRRKKSFLVPSSPAIPEEPFDFSEEAGGVNKAVGTTQPEVSGISATGTTRNSYQPYHSRSSHGFSFSISRKPGSLLRHSDIGSSTSNIHTIPASPPLSLIETEADKIAFATSAPPPSSSSTTALPTKVSTSKNTSFVSTPFISRSTSDLASIASSNASHAVKDSELLGPSPISSPAYISRRQQQRDSLATNITLGSAKELELDMDDFEEDVDENEAMEEGDQFPEAVYSHSNMASTSDFANTSNMTASSMAGGNKRYSYILPMDEIDSVFLPPMPAASSSTTFDTNGQYIENASLTDIGTPQPKAYAKQAGLSQSPFIMDRVATHITLDSSDNSIAPLIPNAASSRQYIQNQRSRNFNRGQEGLSSNNSFSHRYNPSDISQESSQHFGSSYASSFVSGSDSRSFITVSGTHSHSVSGVSESTFDSTHNSVQDWYNEIRHGSLGDATLDSLDINFVPGIDSNETTLDDETSFSEVEDAHNNGPSSFENLTRFIDEPGFLGLNIPGTMGLGIGLPHEQSSSPHHHVPVRLASSDILSTAITTSDHPEYYTAADGIVDTSSQISLHHSYHHIGLNEAQSQHTIQSLHKKKSMTDSFMTTNSSFFTNNNTSTPRLNDEFRQSTAPPVPNLSEALSELGDPTSTESFAGITRIGTQHLQRSDLSTVTSGFHGSTISVPSDIQQDVIEEPLVSELDRSGSASSKSSRSSGSSNVSSSSSNELDGTGNSTNNTTFQAPAVSASLPRAISTNSMFLNEDFSYLANLVSVSDKDTEQVNENTEELSRAVSLYPDLRDSSLVFLGKYINTNDKFVNGESSRNLLAALASNSMKSLESVSKLGISASPQEVPVSHPPMMSDTSLDRFGFGSRHSKQESWSGSSVLNYGDVGSQGVKQLSPVDESFTGISAQRGRVSMASISSASRWLDIEESTEDEQYSRNVRPVKKNRHSSLVNTSSSTLDPYKIRSRLSSGRNSTATSAFAQELLMSQENDESDNSSEEERFMMMMGEPLGSSSARNSHIEDDDFFFQLSPAFAPSEQQQQTEQLQKAQDENKLSPPPILQKAELHPPPTIIKTQDTNHRGPINTENFTVFYDSSMSSAGNHFSMIEENRMSMADTTNMSVSESYDGYDDENLDPYANAGLINISVTQHSNQNSVSHSVNSYHYEDTYDDGEEDTSFASVVQAGSMAVQSRRNKRVSRDLLAAVRNTTESQNDKEMQMPLNTIQPDVPSPIKSVYEMQRLQHRQQQAELTKDFEKLKMNQVQQENTQVQPRNKTLTAKKSREFVFSSIHSFGDLSPNEIHLRTLMTSVESLINEEFASIMAADTYNKRLSSGSSPLQQRKMSAVGTSALIVAQMSPFTLDERKEILSQLEQINDTVFHLYERTRSLSPLRGMLLEQDQRRVVNVENSNRAIVMSCTWTLIGIKERYRAQWQKSARISTGSAVSAYSASSGVSATTATSAVSGTSVTSTTQSMPYSPTMNTYSNKQPPYNQHNQNTLNSNAHTFNINDNYSNDHHHDSNDYHNPQVQNQISPSSVHSSKHTHYSYPPASAPARSAYHDNYGQMTRSFVFPPSSADPIVSPQLPQQVSVEDYNYEMFKKYSNVVTHFLSLEWTRRSEMCEKLGSSSHRNSAASSSTTSTIGNNLPKGLWAVPC